MRRLQIPDISSHTELWLEDEVEDLSWNDNEYKKLVTLLLEQTRWRDEDKDSLYLEINLSLLTGGRSSAHVLKLVFADADDPDIRDILIIRSHLTQGDADKERKNAKILNVNKTDCFANIIEEEAFNFPNRYLVIYQDVASMVARAEANELCQTLFEFIHSKKAMEHFALNFQEVIRQTTVAYGEVEKGHKKIIGRKKYCQGILSQLPPDLVVSHAFLCEGSSGDWLVGSQKTSIETAKLISLNDFLSQISERNISDNWLKFQEKLWLEDSVIRGESKTAYLPFFVKNNTQRVRIWVEIDKNKVDGIESKLDTSKGYELTFFAKEMTFTAQLEKMGFNSCLSTAEFQTLCKQKIRDLQTDMRHNDLHCGNVLTSGNSFKVIDVGDMKADLIASDIARLEVSLWYEMSKRLSEFSKQEAEIVIENLMADDASNTHSLSISTRFSDFLHHLKKGFKAGVQHLPDKNEIVLAYVIQILLYQRYSLLDGVDKIPVAFNVFARHWMSQFRYHIDFAALSAEVREVVHHLESLVDRKRVTWDIILKAYRKSVSEMQKSQFVLKGEEQKCFEAIYRIAELPQNKENPPLAQFSCDIANQLSGPEQTLLNDLISKHFSLSCPQQPETQKASKCHITIEVSPQHVKANHYSITIYRNGEPFLATSDPFEVTELKSILHNKLKETYSDLMTYLDSNELNEKQVLIRFLLPRILLSETVDQYELDGALDTWGTKFKVIISSWERRQSPKFSVPLKTCWDEYKNSLSSQIQCTNNIKSCQRRENYVPTFIVKNSDKPRRVLVNTKNSQVGVAILQFPPKKTSVEEETDYLNVLFQTGVPIILWTREIKSPITITQNGQLTSCILCEKTVHDLQKSPITLTENGQLTSCILCEKTVHDLQSYIYEKRNDALDDEEDSLHIGNHLVLLWDDPELRLDEPSLLRGAE